MSISAEMSPPPPPPESGLEEAAEAESISETDRRQTEIATSKETFSEEARPDSSTKAISASPLPPKPRVDNNKQTEQQQQQQQPVSGYQRPCCH